MNIEKLMQKNLPLNIFRLLEEIGAMADETNTRIFLVGGVVRDILLGVENLDIDLVTEKPALDFAKILSDKWKTGFIAYRRFQTATVKKGALSIDLATTRKEFYKEPGAQPVIKFARIKEDLFRRDFTINAMVVSLNTASFGELIDFFHGMADLKNKQIRVMHESSFMDDPTRILRAERFKRRLGFNIEPHTGSLMKKAKESGVLERIEKYRIEKENVKLK